MLYYLYSYSFFLSFILENKIDDLHLLQSLTREELKELVPCLGERKKIEIALQMKKSVHSMILPSIEDVVCIIYLYFFS